MAIRYPEIHSFRSLYEEVNNLFRELFRFDPSAERALENMEIPPVDIYETENDIVLDLETPGINPAKVSITFSGGKLVIEGMKEEHVEKGRQNYICMERSFGRFQRIIPIHIAVNLKKCTASYYQGILTIKLPKMKEKRSGQTSIKIRKIKDLEVDGEY